MARRSLVGSVDVAILLHVSGACGATVIYDGLRVGGAYQAGLGVAAAAMLRAGVPVLSQRDPRTCRLLMQHLDPVWQVPEGLPENDHWEHAWCQKHFPSG